MFRFIIGAFCLVSSVLFAHFDRACNPDRLFVAPEYQWRQWNFVSGRHSEQNMWGGRIGYEHYAPCQFFGRLFGRYNFGKTTNKLFLGQWYNHELDVEANIGYTYAFGCHDNWLITPYLGGGYLQDREYIYNSIFLHDEYFYVPVGLLIGWDINCDWSIALRGQADIMVFRRNGQPEPRVTGMPKKTNWLAELPITFRMCGGWDLSFVPEYSFRPNTTTESGVEWGSITTWGARLEIGYNW